MHCMREPLVPSSARAAACAQQAAHSRAAQRAHLHLVKVAGVAALALDVADAEVKVGRLAAQHGRHKHGLRVATRRRRHAPERGAGRDEDRGAVTGRLARDDLVRRQALRVEAGGTSSQRTHAHQLLQSAHAHCTSPLPPHLREHEPALVQEGHPVLLAAQPVCCGVVGVGRVLQPHDALHPGVCRVGCCRERLQQHQPLLECKRAVAAQLVKAGATGRARPGLGAKHRIQPLAWPHKQARVLDACLRYRWRACSGVSGAHATAAVTACCCLLLLGAQPACEPVCVNCARAPWPSKPPPHQHSSQVRGS